MSETPDPQNVPETPSKPDPAPAPTPAKPKSAAREAAKKDPQSDRHKRAEQLVVWLRALLRLPSWLRIPLLVLLFLLYSPPLVINLVSVMNATRTHRLRVYSYPQFVYLWPLIIWGILFTGLKALGFSEGFLAWVYMLLVIFSLVTVGFDFKFGGWLGILAFVAVIFAALGWWGSAHDVPVFGQIGDLLSGWLEFPDSWALTLSLMLMLIYLIMMTLRRFNKRLRIHGNLVIIDTLLGKVDRNTRASYGINDDVPDVNELLLGMCSAFILEGKGTVASHEFKNVPGGPLVTRVIEEMLAATAIEDETDVYSGDEGDDELEH